MSSPDTPSPDSAPVSNDIRFDQLCLAEPVLKALTDVGYENPSPIQASTIPQLLAGRDVLGQAQTGTGKTAAFALPILSMIDLKRREPQVLVLAPTRELAIQVAEAFQRYAAHLPGFHVLPIYGGQGYRGQLDQLKRGAQVIVGTPGRVMDHMRRKTLVLDSLSHLVLDEADEMLRMGFIDDVEWVLQQLPEQRQVALFSATMPNAIRRIAQQYLREPAEIRIESKTTTAENIRQRYWMVTGTHKLDALTRMLEAEDFDGMIVFVRTKVATLELAEKLQARGYSSAALNGDIPQQQREQTVEALKAGKLDILIATDVVARGLDVERISHVVNYDIPYDTEAYVHRIGRTGRAGRNGEAILFVAPREKRMLFAIERATRQKIEQMSLPTSELINNRRIARFFQGISDTLAGADLDFYRQLIAQYQQEHNVAAEDIAAALANLAQGGQPMLVADDPPRREWVEREQKGLAGGRDETRSDKKSQKRSRSDEDGPEKGMERFRIEVGRNHGVKPGNIVGAIANEAGLNSRNIGRVNIFDDYSTVDLPEGMPKEIFKVLQNVWVSGQQLRISRDGEGSNAEGKRSKPSREKSGEKSGKARPDRKPGSKSRGAGSTAGKVGSGKARLGKDSSARATTADSAEKGLKKRRNVTKKGP